MPEVSSFDYAVIRVVPLVEREEFVNAGVILFCRTQRFLDCRIRLNRHRLAALDPDFDADMAQEQLDMIALVCQGGGSAGAIGELDQAERFHWLTSPRSTAIQISPVHCGVCTDPQEALDDLFARLVA